MFISKPPHDSDQSCGQKNNNNMANLEVLHSEIVRKLKDEYHFEQSGDYLNKGVCPDCGKKELFTKYDRPYYITCNRRSKCAYETTVKQLMPELFENINEKFPPTDSDPNATAKAYLSLNRGFDVEQMTGWFEQGHYYRSTGNKTTATVKFFLNSDRTVFWERLISPVETKEKDGSTEVHHHNFSSGKRAGLWWTPPEQIIEQGDTVYLCEGILKAIPLALAGKKVASIMASGSFPSISIDRHLGKKVNWVWALDSDDAGRKATHTHHARLLELGEKSTAIFATEFPKKLDWDELSPARLDADSFKRYAYYGRLELVENYQVKAFLMWNHRNDDKGDGEDDMNYFCYDHNKNGYSVTAKRKEYDRQLMEYTAIDAEKEDENKVNAFISTAEIKRISTFSAQFLYFQRFADSEDGEYVFKFRMANGAHDQIVGFSHLSKSDAFKEKCQRLVAGANFMGSNADMSWLYNRWMAHKPPTVSILNYVGYHAEHDAYIFNKIAVQGKKIIPINSEDFFALKKGGVKTAINTAFEIDRSIQLHWVKDYKTAFGYKGMVALTWWMSTFLVQQIRDKHKDYPYLSIIGTAASGKTAMVNFLWKLTGLDGAKMPVNPNVDSKIGFYKSLARFSNIPVQLNEVDNEQSLEHVRGKHMGRFNWNTIKQLYDGENLRSTAQKQGNNLNSDYFKSNLVVTQNVEISDASEAIVTRFCNIPFDRSHHTSAGKLAADRLLNLETKECSGFLLHVITQSKTILAEFNKQLPLAMKTMNKYHSEVGHQRIKDTHGKLLAMAYCLPLVFSDITKEDLANIECTIVGMAIERQTIVNGDHSLIIRFWEMFDDLDVEAVKDDEGKVVVYSGRINHTAKDGLVAVHLPTFTKKCQDRFGTSSVLDISELHRLLSTSKEHAYVDYKVVESVLEKKSMKCYVFKRERRF
jgi:hypothetical protein